MNICRALSLDLINSQFSKRVHHEDQMKFVTDGVSQDYKTVAYQIDNTDTTPSLTEIHKRFLNHEAKIQSFNPRTTLLPTSANMVSHWSNNTNYRGSYNSKQKNNRNSNTRNNNWKYQNNERTEIYQSRPYLGWCQLSGTQGHNAVAALNFSLQLGTTMTWLPHGSQERMFLSDHNTQPTTGFLIVRPLSTSQVILQTYLFINPKPEVINFSLAMVQA